MGAELSQLSAQNIGSEILDAMEKVAEGLGGGTGFAGDLKDVLDQPLPTNSVPRAEPRNTNPVEPPVNPNPPAPQPAPQPTPEPPAPQPPQPPPEPPAPQPPQPTPAPQPAPQPEPPGPRNLVPTGGSSGGGNIDSNTQGGMRVGESSNYLREQAGLSTPWFYDTPNIRFGLVSILAAASVYWLNLLRVFNQNNVYPYDVRNGARLNRRHDGTPGVYYVDDALGFRMSNLQMRTTPGTGLPQGFLPREFARAVTVTALQFSDQWGSIDLSRFIVSLGNRYPITELSTNRLLAMKAIIKSIDLATYAINYASPLVLVMAIYIVLDAKYGLEDMVAGIPPTKSNNALVHYGASFVNAQVDEGVTNLFAKIPTVLGITDQQANLKFTQAMWFFARDVRYRDPNAVDNLFDIYIPSIYNKTYGEILDASVRNEAISLLGEENFLTDANTMKMVLKFVMANPSEAVRILDNFLVDESASLTENLSYKPFEALELMSLLKHFSIGFDTSKTPAQLSAPPADLKILGFQLYHSDETTAPQRSVTDTVDESDKLFAQMAAEAYTEPHKRRELHGYQPYHGTDQHVIYDNGKERILSIRGTSDTLDGVTDIGILLDEVWRSGRVQGELLFAKNNKINKVVGHSLGGTISALISSELGIPAIIFNPGAASKTKIEKTDKIKVYRVAGDAVSTLWKGGNITLLKHRKKESLKHSMVQFLD